MRGTGQPDPGHSLLHRLSRVRGEHTLPRDRDTLNPRSSPRVRETRQPIQHDQGLARFIPACAENTRHPQARRPTKPVLPRVCGEHLTGGWYLGPKFGSSPRVRGTQIGRGKGGRVYRFIPACAGNTHPEFRQHCGRTVHPRVCGEHRHPKHAVRHALGSSPRVRGTRPAADNRPHRARFIPACAGNTRKPRKRALEGTVHPRVCGEHAVLPAVPAVVHGSSPRVRGTLFLEADEFNGQFPNAFVYRFF